MFNITLISHTAIIVCLRNKYSAAEVKMQHSSYLCIQISDNMKRILYTAGLGLTLFISAAAITACGGETKTESNEVAVYQCPMDCEEGKTYDKAGICPVCEMELKTAEVAEAGSEEEAHEHSH